MDVKNRKNIGKLYSPEIFDEIAFCLGCEISSKGNKSSFNKKECQKRISSILDLNFNKSSYI
jgi:hypothetical protein